MVSFGALVIVVAIQAAAIVALLVQRTRRARAERALRESEERFRLVMDRSPAMMWTVRPDTPTLDYLNRTCAEFTGLPIEKLRERGLVGRRPSGRPGPRHRHLRCGVRGAHAASSWSTVCAEPTAPTDGCWPRAFRSMDRTAASRATSAATSTSPNARMPKTGFARAGPPSRSAIGRSSTWPAG